MPGPLSRKRRNDTVQIAPEKRRRVSAGTPLGLWQHSLRIEVQRDRVQDDGHREWQASPCHWCESIDCTAVVQFGQGMFSEDIRIGKCCSLFIEREKIRYEFQAYMKHRSNDTAFLASELFDETGCLKPEFTNAALKSGSGLWNRELNDGNILVIEKTMLPQNAQLGHLGPMLVEQLLQETSRLHRKPFFAFALGIQANAADLDQCMDAVDYEGGVLNSADRQFENGKQSEFFWRANGFRRVGMTPWFAWSSEPNHPARNCYPSADFDLTAKHFFSGNNPSSLIHTDILRKIGDENCVELFQDVEKDISSDELRRIDADGNTLFHLAALSSKPNFISWLIDYCPPETRGWRNFDRQTPLEALLSARSKKRAIEEDSLKYCFEGYDDASVECQLRLCDCFYVTNEIFQRTKFECTCMRCFSGFLSHRTRIKLLAAANRHLDNKHRNQFGCEELLSCTFPEADDGLPGVRQGLQELFFMCLQQIVFLLARGETPTTKSVSRSVVGHLATTHLRDVAQFFHSSSVVESAIMSVISMASIDMASLPNDTLETRKIFMGCLQLLQETPECRNDDNWPLIRRLLVTDRRQ